MKPKLDEVVSQKTHRPLVSVVMVVCNVDRFLAESIESILAQTFQGFEFIIIDFGSTDKSEAIALSYAAKDRRIKFYRIPHCGLAEARNAGCSLAQGRYIAIMDADDVSLPDRLIREVDFMEKHPQVGLLGGATEWIDARGRSLGVHDFPTEDHKIRSELANHCPFCQSTVLMRREAFALAGGYRAVFVQTEDYDLWLRIAEHFPCANLKHVVLKYRIHPYQVSTHKRRIQTLCKLAAQASASSRRRGNADPLNSVREITPETLFALGVTPARQQREVAYECGQWICVMSMAGEHSAALKVALEILQSDLEYVDRWRIADLQLTVARLYWEQGRPLSSIISATQAVLTYPVVVGRPLKPLLRRLGLV